MIQDNEAFNNEVRRWGLASRDEIRAALGQMGARRTGQLIRMVRVTYGLHFGTVSRVTFGFPRYLVFVEKGARRGYGGKKGSYWTGPDGQRRKTDPRSLGRMGTGRSPARPSFNPTMDRRVPILAAIAAEHYANIGVKWFLIK